MNEVIATWRDSLHQVLDLYERKRGSLLVFFPLLFLFFVLLNVACYWWAIYTAFPHYMQTHEASHYLKLQIPVGFLGALFDSLSFFVTLWIIRRALASVRTAEYVMHLSLDLVVGVLATLWVLFVFSFGGWLISLWENVPEELLERGNNTCGLKHSFEPIARFEIIPIGHLNESFDTCAVNAELPRVGRINFDFKLHAIGPQTI